MTETLSNEPSSSTRDPVTDQRTIQVRFVVKDKKALPADINVPTTIVSVADSLDTTALNSVVKKLIEAADDDAEEALVSLIKKLSFDFLLNGKLLRTPLAEEIENQQLNRESVFDLECVISAPPPEPQFALPHEDWIGAVITSKGAIVTGCYDNSLNIWTSTGDLLNKIPAHGASVKCLTWLKSPNAGADTDTLVFASGSMDQTVNIWRYNCKEREIVCLQTCRGHERSVDCIDVCPRADIKRMATGSFDTHLKIWSTDVTDVDVSDDQPSSKKRSKPSRPEETTQLTANAPTGTPLVTLASHREAVTGLSWNPNDPAELWTASWDMTLKGWDLELNGPKQSFSGPKAFTCVRHSILSGDGGGRLLAGACDQYVRLYDARSVEGSMVKTLFRSHAGWVADVRWSPVRDTVFASASYDGLVKVWDVRAPTAPLYDLSGHADRVLCLAWDQPTVLASGGADSMLNVFKV